MGAGCVGLCVPVDLAKSVSALVWIDRPELCEGCRALQTPWAERAEDTRDAVGATVFASGSAPDYAVLVANEPVHVTAAYDAKGKPVAAFRTDYEQTSPCGRLLGLKLQAQKFGAYFLRRVGEAQELLVGEASALGSIMRSRDVSFNFGKDVVGSSGINDFWFSSSRAAIDLSGDLVVQAADVAGDVRPRALPGAAPGEYARAQISDGDVFVTRWSDFRSSVAIVDSSKLRPLLGAETQDIQELVVEGGVMAWKQGRDPVQAAAGVTPPVTFAHYDLMLAPLATDTTALRPRVVVKDVPPSLGWLRLANGFLSGIYLSKTTDPVRSGALVVEIKTGRALRSELPDGFSYGYGLFTSESELWGAITRDPLIHFETYARVPYSAMTLVQSEFPR
jgi:hypothetical protein